MNKLAKTLFMSLVASAATCAFAGEGNSLITFSTEKDFYANGDPVLDGEWYALCWSNQAGGFAGLNNDCTPKNKADKVLICAKLAKGGRCPLTVFQVPEEIAPTDGEYSVYLLDTRIDAKTPAGVENGHPAVVKSSAQSTTFRVNGRTQATIAKTEAEGVAASTGFAIAGGTEVATPASIQSIDPNFSDTQVKIEVANMLPSVSYKVVYGKEIDKLESSVVETDNRAFDATEPVAFLIDKEDAKFFKLDTAK